ncbi:hypothetical protein D3C74_419170 [compost metagenome]
MCGFTLQLRIIRSSSKQQLHLISPGDHKLPVPEFNPAPLCEYPKVKLERYTQPVLILNGVRMILMIVVGNVRGTAAFQHQLPFSCFLHGMLQRAVQGKRQIQPAFSLTYFLYD